MTRKLSPKMTTALKLEFQAELGVSRSDQSVARSGIIEGYMIPTNTSCALIDRGLHTRLHMIHGERWSQAVHQITAAGCEAIGRSMDEIVAWAWREAMRDRAEAGRTGEIMLKLPVEVGAVVGWTHKGEAVTGTVLSIGGGYATIKGDDASPWSVSLDEIERVIELAPTCDHGVPMTSEAPSAFKGAAPVRDYADGCQSYGPYPEHAPMLDMQASAYRYAVEVLDSPRYPEGTSEYEAYSTELHAELEKFAKGEPPYEYTAQDDAKLAADLFTGRADRKALPIVPPAAPKGLMTLVNEAIAAAVQSERVNTLGSAHFGSVRERSDARATATAALEAIQKRLNLAAALMSPEVRQILDGHR